MAEEEQEFLNSEETFKLQADHKNYLQNSSENILNLGTIIVFNDKTKEEPLKTNKMFQKIL